MKLYLKVLKYIKPYWAMVILSFTSSFLFAAINAFSIWMISSLFSTIMKTGINSGTLQSTNSSINNKFENIANQLIGSGSQMEQLKMLCFILLITFIVKNIFFIINRISLSYIGNKMIMNIRNDLYAHLQNLPLSFFHKSKSGELLSIIMHDVTNMRTAFTLSLQSLVNDPISIIIILFMLLITNVKMTLYVLFIVPIAAFIITKLGQSIRRKSMRSTIQIAGIMNIFQEAISGIRIVKAFIMEKFETKRFKKENEKYYKLTFKKENMGNLTIPINDLIGISLGVMLLWLGGKEVLISKTLDPDGFIRYIFYLFAMLQPAKKLGAVNAQIQTGLASSERVFNILNVKSNIINSIKPINISSFNNHIKFKDVFFQYENSIHTSLENINVKIKKGESLAIVGNSGAGKSTLVDLIPRFYEVTKGDILIDNINIKKIDLNNLRQLMGIVTQDTILFNDSIANNISYGQPNATINEIKLAAKTANALEFIENLENGFNTIIGEKGTLLSGGQKQRISIARAILKNPKILILDEATSALDTESERKVQIAIEKLVQNRTVIVIAHRLSTIKNADQILVLDNGKLIETGTHEKLIKNNGHYKKLHDIQFK